MIEKYFLQGVRLKWNCPVAYTMGSKDGSIINDPVQSNAPMTYDGLDAGLGTGLPHVSTLGLRMNMPINYAWLTYAHGHTARRMLSAGDVLTGPMSGCCIAEWTDRGMRWAGHVGTIVGDAATNKKVKNNIGIALPTQARGFYPDKAWGAGDIPALLQKAQKASKFARPTVFALVTTSGKFFSILMFHLGGDEWSVGGCKSVPPINAAQLRSTLL
jgi:hypothetical protein